MVRKDSFFDDVLHYLTTGEFWEGATENEKKVFQQRAAHYEVEDGQLFRVGTDDETASRQLVIVDPSKRLEAIQECHIDPNTQSHLSKEKTKANLNAKYFWNGMHLDVLDFIRQCPGCYSKDGRTNGRSPLVSGIGKRSQLWKMLEVEISGPFSMESNSCLVNIIDLVSKWISCIPVKAFSPKEIAKSLVAEFSIMGLPSAVRFIKLNKDMAIKLVTEIENELKLLMNTVEDISDLLRQEMEDNSLACPKLVVSQIIEDEQFSISDVEALEVLISNKIPEQEGFSLYLHVFIGECSLLEESTRLWHLDTFSRFRKLYPHKWDERLAYYSFCLRSCLPPSSTRTPNYLMFFREMDIFKFTPDQVKSLNSSEIDDEDSEKLDSFERRNNRLLLFNRIQNESENPSQISIDFEEDDEVMMREDKENEDLDDLEEEEEEEDEDLDGQDFDGMTYHNLDTNGIESEFSNIELSDRRGLRTSPRKTNSLYGRNTSPSVRRKRLPDLYDSEEEGEDSIPPKKRKKPFIVALKGSKFRRKNAYILNRDRIPCTICEDVYFLTQADLDNHLRFHVDGSKEFKCPDCDKVGHQWGSMFLHYTSLHEQMGAIMSTPNEESNSNFDGDVIYRCPYCAKEFTVRERMLRHLRVIHLGKKAYHCEICKEEFKQKKFFIKHLASHENRIYNCEDCNFTTKVHKNYKIHKRMHERYEERLLKSNGGELQCPLCKESFPVRSSLTSHMSAVHGAGGQRVLCEHCGVSLKSRGSLMAHVKRMHRETQWLLCSHCGFKAKTTSNLNAHIDRIHKKAFRCPMCPFATKEENSYRRHMDIFHNEQRKFPCPHCEYRGANAKSLSEHMRVQHNPTIQRFSCNYCNASFKTLSMLRDHIPGHTGIAIYSCRLCDYQCKYRSNAHRHAKAKHPGLLVKDCILRAPSQDSPALGPAKRKERGSSSGGLSKTRMPQATATYMETLDPGAVTLTAGNDVIVSADSAFAGQMISHSLIASGSGSGTGNPSSVLTVDAQTGQLLFDTETVSLNNNVSVQVMQDDTPHLAEDDQTGRAVELLLLAMGQNRH